jgi:hypothetical protein
MGRTPNHRCPRTGKYRYAGQTEATITAMRVTANNVKEGQEHPDMGAYPCADCMGWHIGHVIPSKVRNAN